MSEFDQILVMTGEPGYGGHSLILATLEKVALLRTAIDESGATLWVQVGGGINHTTIRLARDAGAHTFAAGSAIFGSDDPEYRIADVRALLTR